MRSPLGLISLVGTLALTTACAGSGGGSGGAPGHAGAAPTAVKTTDGGPAHVDAGDTESTAADTSKGAGW